MDNKTYERYIEEISGLIYLNKIACKNSYEKPRTVHKEVFGNGDIYVNFWIYNNLYASHKLEDLTLKIFYKEIYKSIFPNQFTEINEWYKITNRDYNISELFR